MKTYKLLSMLKKACFAFRDLPPLPRATLTVTGLLLLLLCSSFIYDSISDASGKYRENHLSPSEHLQRARELCPERSGEYKCTNADANQAMAHLGRIPPNTPEYSEGKDLLSSIQSLLAKREAVRKQQEEEQSAAAKRAAAERAAAIAKEQAERSRLMNQSEDESIAQMMKNVNGKAHDAFVCNTSTENTPIMSFDYGHYWWGDDGRCAAQQARQQELLAEIRAQQEEAERQTREQEQRKRDEDAELSSYWPTTIRVDTDMDSFWLRSEERTCKTYPDSNGRVSIVACNATGSHRDHNIPVKFWGAVDRNTVSEWKCRREGDDFVCRALD
jgi:hypothetical protein